MISKKENNKPKILFTNFGRLEKNLFFQFDYSENFDVVGIVSDLEVKSLVNFLKYDSNHGKSSNDKFVIMNDKKDGVHIVYKGISKMNIKIIKTNELNKSVVKKVQTDIIVDFSDKTNLEIIKLSKFGVKAVILNSKDFLLSKNKSNINCYGLKHQNIDISKNNLVVIPRIESIIISLMFKYLNPILKINHIDFEIIRGPKKGMKIVDTILSNDIRFNSFEFSRSIINNIIPSDDYISITEEIKLLNENKKQNSISGNVSLIPVTTGSIINLTFYNEKIISFSDFNKFIKEKISNLIGYTIDRLVSQDIVSTEFYGVIEKNLLKYINKKNISICKIGIWFDYETSYVISVFKTIQYIVGTSGFNSNSD